MIASLPTGQPLEPSCPRCGAPYREGQEYCLECGRRLAGGGGVAQAFETAWRDRFGSYPGDWVWAVLLGLLVAAAGATAAIVFAGSGGDDGHPIVATGNGSVHAPTSAPPTETVALPTVPSGTPTTTGPQPTTTTPTTTTPTPPPGSLARWPAGRNGFTVVLESIPARAGRSFAVARARAAARAGLPEVGVLNSSRYSSLHPGFLVVFSGIYDSRSEADRARVTAREKGYSVAYARDISR